jgi:hypothetical protein
MPHSTLFKSLEYVPWVICALFVGSFQQGCIPGFIHIL